MALGNTTVARLQAVLDADTSSFDRKMKQSETRTQKFGAVAKTALIGGVAAGVTAVGVAAKIGWDEYNAGAKVAAQTNAVIKSTGGVANVTADHLDALGETLMRLSGVDDELIKSGENVLLTFKAVRNEQGKGNDIFDQTTKLALDLSTALGTDLQSANIQLGKALQGSSTGLTALKRSGVTFNDTQVAIIQHLFATNQTLKAQKMILAEVSTEFGGSAKAVGDTFGGQLLIARERLNNFLGDLVEQAIPALQRLATKVMPLVNRLFARGANVVEAYRQGIGDITKALDDHQDTVGVVTMVLGKMITVLGVLLKIQLFWLKLIIRLDVAIIKLVGTIGDKLIAAFHRVVSFGRSVGNVIESATNAVQNFFQAVWNGVQRVLGPIGKLADVFGSIKGVVSGASGAVTGFFSGGLPDGIVSATAANPGGLNPRILDDLALSQGFGLSLTSGFRPGAVTSSGNPSLHGVGRAIDVAGSESAMRRFFLFEAARGAATGLAEVIHSPYWWHPGSGIGRITDGQIMADHYSHVHVGTYDKGGYLKPGWNLAYNGLGRPEPVGGGVTVILNGTLIDDRAGEKVVKMLEDWQRRGGRAF